MSMPCLATKSFLILLPFFVILSTIQGATSQESAHYTGKTCQEKKSYISGSAFETNLNDALFTELLPKASTVKFSNSTKGVGEDQVYALFYCRGDVNVQTCHNCVEAATSKITDVCKFCKEGIVWFEECTLRYANRSIFSISEESPKILYTNSTGIVNNYRLDKYKERFDTAMDGLVTEAAYGKGSLRGFASKEVNLSSSEVILGLAQCSPDIGGHECYRCLTTALRLRDSWANTMVFLSSCHFRYDLYETAASPDPPSPPPKLPSLYIALIAVLPVVAIALVVIVVVAVKNHRRKRRELQGEPNNDLRFNGDVERNLPNEHEEAEPERQLPNEPVQTDLADLVDRVALGLPKYTYSQVKKMTNFNRTLGKGGFGIVYYGVLKGDNEENREVAVKSLCEKKDAPEQFINEIHVLQQISHRNLVSLLGYCHEGTKMALIYEYIDNGDLKDLLSKRADSLSWTDRLKIAIDTAEGLDYLHRTCSVSIVHRDVKPANILINKNLHAKLADFGLSKIFSENDTTLQTRVVSTHGYTDPVYFNTSLLNKKVDVYSFGAVLLELITGKSPSESIKWFKELVNIEDIKERLDPNTKKCNQETSVLAATKLARACVDDDGTKRPDMSEVLQILKHCLCMEVENNAESSASASTSA